MVWSILFVTLAATCNALMDSVEYETAFNRSIFSSLNPKWWCKTVSWQYINFIPFTKYRLDAWHLFKSLMIIAQISAIVSYKPIVNELIDIILFGLIWNMVFNLFYNHIFRK
jgi:hypothetical protein